MVNVTFGVWQTFMEIIFPGLSRRNALSCIPNLKLSIFHLGSHRHLCENDKNVGLFEKAFEAWPSSFVKLKVAPHPRFWKLERESATATQVRCRPTRRHYKRKSTTLKSVNFLGTSLALVLASVACSSLWLSFLTYAKIKEGAEQFHFKGILDYQLSGEVVH